MVLPLTLLLGVPLDIKPTWSLVCGGDIMLNGVSTRRDTFRKLPIAKDAIFYANLEIPLTDTAEQTTRKTPKELREKQQFILKANPKHIGNLVSAGLDVVSLGNNHAMDGGASGLLQMQQLLTRSKIQFCGAGSNWAEAVKPKIVIAPDNTRVAFISYLSFLNRESLRKCTPATTTLPGIAALTLSGEKGKQQLALLQGIVERAKRNADMLVVCLHWGVERAPLPSAYQVDLARLFVDAGADAIVGSHPHVLQPAELYRGKPILYSLGNFVHPGTGNTALYELTFTRSKLIGAKPYNLVYRGGVVSPTQQNLTPFLKAEAKLESSLATQGLINAFIQKTLKPNQSGGVDIKEGS
jgi:hypothetical protein